MDEKCSNEGFDKKLLRSKQGSLENQKMKNTEMVRLTIKFFSGLDEVWPSGHAFLALITRN